MRSDTTRLDSRGEFRTEAEEGTWGPGREEEDRLERAELGLGTKAVLAKGERPESFWARPLPLS